MYNTAEFAKKKEKENKKNIITVKAHTVSEKFNSFQTGHGAHGGTVKAQNKRNRKDGKNMCRKALKEYR
jgi:hypothetical protein